MRIFVLMYNVFIFINIYFTILCIYINTFNTFKTFNTFNTFNSHVYWKTLENSGQNRINDNDKIEMSFLKLKKDEG